VDTKADVGRVLPALTAARNLDQFDGRLVQGRRVLAKAAPVGVSFFGDDFPLFDKPLDHPRDVELVTASLEAKGEILEVNKDRQLPTSVAHIEPPPQPVSPRGNGRKDSPATCPRQCNHSLGSLSSVSLTSVKVLCC